MTKNKKQQQEQQKVCPFIYEENYVIPKDINTSHNITQFIEQPVLDKYICKNVNENGIVYDWLNHWFTAFKTANKKSKSKAKKSRRKANSKKPTYSTTEEKSKQETKTGPLQGIKNFIEKISGNKGKQLIPCPISDETHFFLPKNLVKDPIDIIGSNTLTKTICKHKKPPITGDLISFGAILFLGSVYLIKRFTNKANIARNRGNQPLNSDTLLNSMQVETSFQDIIHPDNPAEDSQIGVENGGNISPIPSNDEGNNNSFDDENLNPQDDSLHHSDLHVMTAEHLTSVRDGNSDSDSDRSETSYNSDIVDLNLVITGT